MRPELDGVRRYVREPMARVALRGRLQHPYRRWRFASFGKGSIVHRPDWLYGTHRIAIGEGVIILAHAWLGAEPATWKQTEPAITIGDGTTLRTNAVISASSSVTIEENVLVGAQATIVDSDHTITEIDQNPLWNPVESAPVRIGAGTWIGERVTVLRGARIGRKCIIGAHSVVRGEIPDGSVAAGIPAKVVGSTAGATGT